MSDERTEVKGRQRVFVERLGVGWLAWFAVSWVFGVRYSDLPRDLFVIDEVSRGARMLAALLRVCGIPIEIRELDFDFFDDVRLPDGSRARDDIYFNATSTLLRKMERDPQHVSEIRLRSRAVTHERYIHAFLWKKIASALHLELRSVSVAAWYSRTRLGTHYEQAVLYVKRSWLFDLLSEYALQWNVQLRSLPEVRTPLASVARHLGLFLRRTYLSGTRISLERAPLDGAPPRVAAEIYMNGIKRQPFYHTEFFWYRKPNLPPGAVFGYFAHPQDQPTRVRQALLKEAGIGWLNRATLRQLMHAPSQRDGQVKKDTVRRNHASEPAETQSQKALRNYIKDFYSEYDRWRSFFIATGTRVHVSTFDIFPESEALHAALSDVGGVSVSIQRSMEHHPYIARRTVTDAHFAFSRAQRERERLADSSVRQFIVCGYPFDDAFPAARTHAKQLVSRLRALGVTFTLCFFDENHGGHRKWLGGKGLTQDDYSFLCDRLAADKTLGLILKPKRPETLPERLGPVWPRVQHFIDSGRCIFLAGRPLDERYLPCVGAFAADLAINLLYGGTAGLESYLAGTRALLIRHNMDAGAFGKLPEGSVVFDTWGELWQAVERFRANPGDPHIGNWEPIIEEFASLRDGRASERIGNYITWLYEAFASGKSRDEAMEYAGGRYAATWGADLITRIAQPFPERGSVKVPSSL